jgi:hypothetical protein
MTGEDFTSFKEKNYILYFLIYEVETAGMYVFAYSSRRDKPICPRHGTVLP